MAVVALGGGLGAPARYAVGRARDVGTGRFPWATLAVNVTGSLALGFLLALVLVPSRSRPAAVLATGFLGADTTHSAFAVGTDLLRRHGRVAVAVAYVAASLVAGFASVWADIPAARALPRKECAGEAGGPPEAADDARAGPRLLRGEHDVLDVRVRDRPAG